MNTYQNAKTVSELVEAKNAIPAEIAAHGFVDGDPNGATPSTPRGQLDGGS